MCKVLREKVVHLLDDADFDIAADLVAGTAAHRQTATYLESATHKRLGKSDVKRYSQANCNRRADRRGCTDVSGGIG
jgi:hypothetical protein